MNGRQFYNNIWHPGMLVVSNYERHGMQFDTEAARRGAAGCEARMSLCETTLQSWCGNQDILWSSRPQLSQYLYGTVTAPATKNGQPIRPLGLEVPPIAGNLRAVKITKRGKTPTAEASLAWLIINYPEHREGLMALIEWQGYQKLLGFYQGLGRFVGPDGRIHSRIRASTETGRLASANPNLQNLPPEARKLFVAPPGKLLVNKDFSGLEWRILAHILAYRYGDYSLVNDIKAGIDPHNATALQMFNLKCAVEDVKKLFPDDRDAAKILNYSINYGKTGKGLALQLTIGTDENGIPFLRRDPPMTEAEGDALIASFYRAKPGVRRWHTDCVEFAQANGYAVTLLGRKRPIPQFGDSRWWVRDAGKRLAMNTPIQGGAMDVVLLSMLVSNPDPAISGWHNAELHELGAKQVLQIHDELVFEVPEENADRVSKILDNVMPACLTGVRDDFLCPLAVSGGIGKNLGEAK